MPDGYRVNLGNNSILDPADVIFGAWTTFTTAQTIGAGQWVFTGVDNSISFVNEVEPGVYYYGTDGFVYFVPTFGEVDTLTSASVVSNPFFSTANVVDGTAAGEVINTAFVDAQGDRVDDGSSLSGAGNDDVVYGAGGNDTISSGAGNDTVFGGFGNDVINGGGGNDVLWGFEEPGFAGTENLSWAAQGVNNQSVAAGFTQDTGLMNVSVSFTNDGNNAPTYLLQEAQVNYVEGGEPFDPQSSLRLFGNGDAATSTTRINFASGDPTVSGEVQNVVFRINDIDHAAGNHRDVVVVRAFDAANNPVTVTLTAAGADVVTGDTVTAADGLDDPDDAQGSVLVEIAGPVSRIEISYSNAITGTHAIWLSDVFFDVIPLSDNDTIDGGGGNDTIFGQAGNDLITGGTGNDSIDGGDSNDTVDGGTGNDTISGGAGADSLIGGVGTDSISGGDGNDTIDGGTNNDTISGGAGADSILGDAGADSISGDDGDDTIDGGTGNDTISGGTGADSILGGAGADSISGDDGNDTIDGGSENDTIDGGAGADSLSGGAGADSILGGTSNDTIDAAQGDTVDGGDGDDLIRLLDLVEVGAAGITIIGGEGAEIFGDTLDLNGIADRTTLSFTINTTGEKQGSVQLTDGSLVTFTNIENIICFTPGTLIATAQGPRPVEDLRRGDWVVTRDHGLQQLRWIGRRTVAATGAMAPVRIDPVLLSGATAPLLVSPQHRILWQGPRAQMFFGEAEVLVTAKHLLASPAARQVEGGDVTYLHLMFDHHEIVLANGVPTESFYPGDMALGATTEAARSELMALFPDLATGLGTFGDTARLCLKAHEAGLLVA